MEATGYYCRICLAKDENYEFILMTGRNEHLKIKFEKCFGIFVSKLWKKKHPVLTASLISVRFSADSFALSSLRR